MSNYISSDNDSSSVQNYSEVFESRLFKPSPGFAVDNRFSHEKHPDLPCAGSLGGVPSQAEAEEAADRLRAIFVYGPEYADRLPISKKENEGSHSLFTGDPCCEVSSSVPCLEVQELEISRRHWERSFSQKRQSMDAGSSTVVAQCVELFQQSHDVQAAVMSLVTDPALWNAFVANEKVQELVQKRNAQIPRCGTRIAIARERDFDDVEGVNPLQVAFTYAKNVVWDTLESVGYILRGIFGFADKKIFGDPNADPLNQHLKACMVLAILTLALVIFDRHPQTLISLKK